MHSCCPRLDFSTSRFLFLWDIRLRLEEERKRGPPILKCRGCVTLTHQNQKKTKERSSSLPRRIILLRRCTLNGLMSNWTLFFFFLTLSFYSPPLTLRLFFIFFLHFFLHSFFNCFAYLPSIRPISLCYVSSPFSTSSSSLSHLDNHRLTHQFETQSFLQYSLIAFNPLTQPTTHPESLKYLSSPASLIGLWNEYPTVLLPPFLRLLLCHLFPVLLPQARLRK